MPHPFQDKLFAFIGEPERCTIRAARDALDAVGGVTDTRISAFTKYAVEFRHNGKSDKYKKAVKYDRNGLLTMLNEQQFFDILEGITEPPVKPKEKNNTIVIPALDPEREALERERTWQDILGRKRMNNMAKYGVPTPDGSRVKADLRHLDMANRVMEKMKEQGILNRDKISGQDRCDDCGKPVRVHIGDGAGGEIAKLCLDCHNKLMAAMTNTEIPDIIPKRLAFENGDGEIREFDIEFHMYSNGKSLTATEIGETKRKTDVYGDLDDEFDEMMDTLTEQIKRLLSVTYMRPDGYIESSKAVGYIEYNRERGIHEIIIDGKPFTWAELEKNISAHEGWKIKIEFGDIGDDLDSLEGLADDI